MTLTYFRANDMIQDFERIRVLIRNNGSVHWEPGGVFVTTCDIDITFFPFDTQVQVFFSSLSATIQGIWLSDRSGNYFLCGLSVSFFKTKRPIKLYICFKSFISLISPSSHAIHNLGSCFPAAYQFLYYCFQGVVLYLMLHFRLSKVSQIVACTIA